MKSNMSSINEYEILFENSAIGVALLKPDGRFLNVNKKLCEILGYSKNELLSMTFVDVTHPNDLQLDEMFIEQVMLGKIDSFQIEKRYIHKNGEEIWVRLYSNVSRNNKGEVDFAIASIVDITEEYRNRKAIVNSEAKYRTLIETASDALYMMDDRGRIIDTNQCACDMLGRTKKEICSLYITEVDPNFTTDQFVEFWENTPFDEQRIFETTHVKKDGTLIPIEISGKKFKINEEVFYYGIARDLTERKRSEEKRAESEAKFRSYIENAPYGVFLANNKGDYIDVNSAAEEITGYTSDELLEMNLIDLIPEDKRVEAGEHFKSVSTLGRASGDLPFIKKDGSKRMWNVEAVKISEDKLLAFVTDITLQKDTENALIESELKFRSSFEHSEVGMAIINEKGVITSVNKAGCRMLFCSIDKLLNKPFIDILHPDDRKDSLERFKSNIEKNQSYTIERRFLLEDGTVLYGLTTISPVVKEGEFLYAVVHVQDITDRIKAEKALKNSETKYRQMFEANMAVKLIIDPDTGEIVEANDAALAFYGYKREEITRMRTTDINTLPKNEVEQEMKRAKLQKSLFFNFQHKLSNGEIRDVEVYSGPVEYEGRKLLYSIINDVTSRKQAELELRNNEELLRKMAENYPDSYLSIIEKDFSIGFTSGQEFKNQSLDPNDFIGLKIEEVFGEHSDLVKSHYKNTFKGEPQEFELFINDQYQIYRCVPLYADDGSIPRILSVVQNITKRKNAEDKLKLSEEKYRKLFESMLDGFALHEIILDENGKAIDYRFIEVNEAFKNLTDLNSGKIVGDKLSDIPGISKEEVRYWTEKYGNVAINQDEIRFESYSETFAKWYSIVAFSPRKGQFATIFQDVTERKENERKLHIITERLKLSTESAQIGIWDLDLVNDVLTWDERMYEIYGITPKDFDGAYEAWKKGVHPEDVERANQDVEKAINGVKDFHTEFRVVWPSGEVRNIEAHAIVTHDKDGTPLKMTGVNFDITERKLAEQKIRDNEIRYRALFELANDPIFVANPDTGIIIDVNKKAEELLGKSKNEIVGQHQSKIHPPTKSEKYKEGFEDATRSKGKRFTNMEVIHKDGHCIPVEISSGGRIELGGESAHIGVFRDISERLTVEKELKNYRDNLEEMVREKTKELEIKNTELERFNKLFIGREFRIKELKEKVKELEHKLNLNK